MRFSYFHNSREFQSFEMESRFTVLNLALWLTDAFIDDAVSGRIHVRIKNNRTIKSVKNQSGYICFKDLPLDNYVAIIESDPVRTDWFFPQEIPFRIQLNAGNKPITTLYPDTANEIMLDRLNPVHQVNLMPKPSYPFPKNATLVRGILINRNSDLPMDGAAITVLDKPNTSSTNSKGEFVLFFKGVEKEDITLFVDGIKILQSVSIHDGETTNVRILKFPP